MVGSAGALVNARRCAAGCLLWLALATGFSGCKDEAVNTVAPTDTFAAAAQLAQKTQTPEDIGRAIDRFERLGKAVTATDMAALGDLARHIEETAPIEAIRMRILLGERPITRPALAAETARALAEAGLVHTAQAASTYSAQTPSSSEGSEEPTLPDRIAIRDAMATRLQLPARTPAAKRLLDILTQSPYPDPDRRFWDAAADASATSQEDPASVCRVAQFTGSQLLGRETEIDLRYRQRSEKIDTIRRPMLRVREPETAAFNVLELAPAAHLMPITLCPGEAEAPTTSLMPTLATAGVTGTVIQEICIGTTAAAVVQDEHDSSHRVILLSPARSGVDVVQSTKLDSTYLRRLRGPAGQPVLLVGIVGGAHGYLSAAVLDPASKQQLLAANMLEFGEVNALPFRQMQSDSLWFRFAAAKGREPCGQCPRYRKVIHVDSAADGYRVAGELCSAQEVASASSGFMSANAMVSVLSGEDPLGFGIAGYARFVDRERQTGRAPKDFVPQMIENFLELTENMQRAGDFIGLERRAIDLEAALAKVPPFEPALYDAAARAAARTAQMEAAYYRGDLERAIDIGERSIREPYSTGVPRIRLDFANRLSSVYLAQQNFRAAFPHLELAQALDNEGQSAVPGNLAWYSIQASDYRKAAQFAMRAMDAAVKNGGRIGINAGFMAMARARSVRIDEGLDWLVFATKVAGNSGDRPDQALALLSAARLALDADEPRLGLVLLEQSMIYMDETIWITEGPNYALLQARLLQRLGDPNGARALATLAVDLTRGRPTSVRAESLTLLSRLAGSAGDAPAALALARDGFRASVDVATNWQGEGYQLASAESAREAAESYLTLLSRGRTPSTDTIFDALARWKSHVLRDGLVRRRNTGPSEVVTSTAATAALLATDEAYVDYFIGQQSAFALVLHGGGVRLVPLPETATSVRTLVRTVQSEMDVTQAAVRDRIGRHRLSAELEAALQRLHALLIAPLKLPPTVRRLDIAPDSAVGSVPWSALRDPADRYLGERMAVLVVPGASFISPLPACTGERCAARTLVAGLGRTGLTSGTADDGGKVTLPPLRYGREELKQLNAMWGERWVELSDRDGRPAPHAPAGVLPWLTQHAARIQALHIVGHGSFNHIDPVKSRLYIEPAGRLPFVTAAQLSTLNLAGLPLVMIGACESGALQSQGGGEPLGLVRAFLAGGADRVVASQWLVDDRATLMLTTSLHEKLKQRLPVTEAFFDAQREVARRYPHPYFWAAFQMHGRPER